jgi:hypothetical protein
MKTRKEKIQFLKRILKNESRISDLIPKKLESFIHDDQNPGKYFRSGSKTEFFTRDQLTDYQKKHPWIDTLIINRCRINKKIKKDENVIDLSLNFELPNIEPITNKN